MASSVYQKRRFTDIAFHTQAARPKSLSETKRDPLAGSGPDSTAVAQLAALIARAVAGAPRATQTPEQAFAGSHQPVRVLSAPGRPLTAWLGQLDSAELPEVRERGHALDAIRADQLVHRPNRSQRSPRQATQRRLGAIPNEMDWSAPARTARALYERSEYGCHLSIVEHPFAVWPKRPRWRSEAMRPRGRNGDGARRIASRLVEESLRI